MSVGEIFMSNELCNCGKPVQYSHPSGMVSVGSCNKYKVCKTYEELVAENAQLKNSYERLAEAAEDLTVFREGTSNYKIAEAYIRKVGEKFRKEVKWCLR